MDYTCFVISNHPELFPPIQQSLSPIPVTYFDGTGYPSFSKLVNDCVESSKTEVNILMSDRVLPTPEHVQKVLQLIEEGYAFVGLYRFAFFGFKKELFRMIGPMDEQFVGGGYEDDDFYIRLRESKLPAYITAEVPYTRGPTRWPYGLPGRLSAQKQRLMAKWDVPNLQRLTPEAPTRIELGPRIPTTFLHEDQSYVTAGLANRYFANKPLETAQIQ